MNMNEIRIDPTITVGHILTTLAILAGGAGIYLGVKLDIASVASDVRTVSQRVEKVENALHQLTAVTITAARLEEKYQALGSRVDRIEGAKK